MLQTFEVSQDSECGINFCCDNAAKPAHSKSKAERKRAIYSDSLNN